MKGMNKFMQYAFFFVSAEDAKDGTKLGYAYAKSKQSEWITKSDDYKDMVSSGQVGVAFVVHDGKAYNLYKKYIDVDSSKVIVICTESTYGSDTKVFN